MIIANEEVTGKLYKKLIQYACLKSDRIMFKIERESPHEKRNIMELKKFLEILGITFEEAMKQYQDKDFLENVYNLLKDKKGMPWNDRIEELDQEIRNGDLSKELAEECKVAIIKRKIENVLLNTVGKTMYEEKIKMITKRLQQDFLNSEMQDRPYELMILYEKYFYQMSDTVKAFLLEQDDLFGWKFPNLPEDIAFFDKDRCWMEIVAHEHLAFMEIDEQEKKELEEIGIRMYED